MVIVAGKRFEVDEDKIRILESYSGLLNIFNCNSVPTLVIIDEEQTVINYVNFLLGESINGPFEGLLFKTILTYFL